MSNQQKYLLTRRLVLKNPIFASSYDPTPPFASLFLYASYAKLRDKINIIPTMCWFGVG
jgi:hypothetical protein